MEEGEEGEDEEEEAEDQVESRQCSSVSTRLKLSFVFFF